MRVRQAPAPAAARGSPGPGRRGRGRHDCLTKRAEHQLRLSEEGGDYGLDPATGLGGGKPHDPEKKRLSEIIEALNDIFGAEVSDEDQLQFLTGIANRISRQEDVMAQVNNHSVEQVMRPVPQAML